MREFIKKAIQKSRIMNEVQLRGFVSLINEEYTLLDSVLSSVNDGVIVANSQNRIIISNPAIQRILEHPLNASYDKLVWEQLQNKNLKEFIKNTIEQQNTEKSKELLLAFDEKEKYIEVSIMPFVKEKKVRGTVIVIADITEKRHEEIKSRRLESLASLTNVAAAVAHEIKNPLAAMSIHIQLLKKNFKLCNMDVTVKIKKHIRIIEEEIERLNKIVVDFLFAVRPLSIEFSSININNIIKNLHNTFNEEFSTANIHFSLDLDKNINSIQGDERFLRQALMNILVNAKAAMPTGGSLEIKTRLKNEVVTIAITDSGEGISEKNLHKIFEPYFTTKHDGTGLGLTMAYKVIKEHQGDISVYSDYGIGTTFKISLPITRCKTCLFIPDNRNK